MQGNPTVRFWAKVDKSGGPEACWPWTAALHRPNGYGRLNGPIPYAHRMSWVLHHGSIPDGLLVLHHCDNPPCVNPAHLFVGTQRDNLRDAARKGRTVRGVQSRTAKLSENDVRVIRSLGKTMTIDAIARRYGMTHVPILYILRRRTWKHVD